MGEGENYRHFVCYKSYQAAILGPIRWPIGSLTNFGPLFTFWDTQFSLGAPLIQFMEGGFFKEICYIKNHPIALYCTLIENPRGFWPLFSYLARIFSSELTYLDHFRHYSSANGHITLNTPVLVRSLKLSSVEPSQYLDGWPPSLGQSFFFFFLPKTAKTDQY